MRIHRVLCSAILALIWSAPVWAQAPSITTGPNLGTFSIGEVQIPLQATGGAGPYTWTATGTLPPGLALRTDLPTFFPATASAGIIGVATTPGTYNFFVTVTSAGQSSAPLALTVRITNLTLRDMFNLPDSFAGVPYTYTFAPVGATGPVVFDTTLNVTGPGPNPFTLSAGGVLTGTPTVPGTYRVNLDFTDQTTLDRVFRGFNILVSALQITGPSILPNASLNSQYTAMLTAHGGDGNYTFSASNLPPGLVLTSLGLITGTPNNGPRVFSVNVTVSDPGFGSYSKPVAIDVVNVPAVLPSQYTYGNLDDCTIGNTCGRAFGANQGTAPFTWSVAGLPPGMSTRTIASPNNPPSSFITPGDLELYGAPLAAGSYPLSITVTDANSNSSTQMYVLRVSTLAIDPTLPNGTQGTPYSGTMRVLGGVGPYTTQLAPGPNLSCNFLPAGLTLSGLTAFGTPLENGNFCPLFKTADSGSGSLTLTNYVTIAGSTPSPITVNTYNPFYITVNQSFNFQLDACCSSPYTWSQIGGALPPGITLNSAGLLNGSAGTAGTFMFLVRAANGVNSGARQITIVVTPLALSSGAPTFGNVGTPYNQVLTVTGATAPVTWTLTAGTFLPPGLSLVGNAITGIPTAPGSFPFSITATDSAAPSPHSDLFFFTINIYAAGVSPPVSFAQGGNLGTYAIGDDQAQLFATGGNGTYTWQVTGGNLPPGLALRSDTPPFFSPSASAGIIGLATTPGTYNFTLSVTSAGQTATQLYTMKIANLLVKDTFQIPDAFAGVSYPGYGLSAIHVDNTPTGPLTWTLTGSVPPGMTFTNGLIAGTPTASGNYNISFNVSDGIDTVFRSVNILVSTVQITSPGVLPNGVQGPLYSFTLNAAGGVGPYTWSLSSLPNGLSLNSSTGVISGIINNGPGPFNFNATATDSNHASYNKSMEIDVIGLTPAIPGLVPYNPYSDCSLGVPCERAIHVFSGGTAPFTWNVTNLPPGMAFRFGAGGNNGNMQSYVFPMDVELWGTPTAAGTFNYTVKVADSAGVTASQTYAMHVSVLTLDTFPQNGTINTPYSSTMRVLGGSGTYTAQAVSGSGALPAGLSLTGLTLSGIPVENGSFNPNIVFTDTTSPTPATLELTTGIFINGPANGTIQVFNQNFGSFVLNSPFNFQFGACCASSLTWTVVSGAVPPGTNLSSQGVLSGTFTTAGTFNFLVQAADSSNPANFGRRLITITVSPISIGPNGLPGGVVGATYSAPALTATGSTGTLTWSTILPYVLPPGLTLNASTGQLSGTPTATGQYTVEFSVNDSAGNSATRFFSINVVYAPLVITSTMLSTTAAGMPFSQTLTATGGQVPYTWQVVAGRLPSGLSLNPVTGLISGTPTNVQSGSLTFQVSDSATPVANTATIVLTLNVSDGRLLITTTSLANGTVNTPYSQALMATGGTAPYSWTLVAGSLPNGLTLNAAGQISGTPTAPYNFRLVFQVTDSTKTTPLTALVALNLLITQPSGIPGLTGAPH